MALEPEIPVLEFIGNGSATVFDHVPHFTLSDPTHLSVAVDGEVIEDGFTQTATGIVFDTAPATGVSIILRRTTPLSQPLTTEGLRVYALERIAGGLDRVMRILQDRFPDDASAAAFARALSFPRFEPPGFATQLPLPHLRKDSIVFFATETGEMEILRLDQLAQRLLVILGAEPILPYRTREASESLTVTQEDVNSAIRINSSEAVVITLPETDDFSGEAFFTFFRFGSGSVSFAAPVGVLIESAVGSAPRIFGQKTPAVAQRIGVNRWLVYGDLY